jgi:hypothetical protein
VIAHLVFVYNNTEAIQAAMFSSATQAKKGGFFSRGALYIF